MPETSRNRATRLLCWNTAWNRKASQKGTLQRQRILEADADIICCPEAYDDFLPDEWFRITSAADHGYPITRGRYKVALWSRSSWTAIDHIGDTRLPPGRFVAGVTETPAGQLQVIGVCIPWSMAHVTTGRKDSARWDEHMLYLEGLTALLKKQHDIPTVVIGDFNQRMPRKLVPAMAADALEDAMQGLNVWTAGTSIEGLEKQPVCHIAGSPMLSPRATWGISRDIDDVTVSDHDGLIAEVEAP